MTNAENEAVEVAEETLAGDLMNIAIEELKYANNMWPMLAESEQEEVLERIRKRTIAAAAKAAQIIHAMAIEKYTGEIESLTFKDGCKVVVKAHPATLEEKGGLASLVGDTVIIACLPREQLEGGAYDAKSDPDQPELPMGAAVE